MRQKRIQNFEKLYLRICLRAAYTWVNKVCDKGHVIFAVLWYIYITFSLKRHVSWSTAWHVCVSIYNVTWIDIKDPSTLTGISAHSAYSQSSKLLGLRRIHHVSIHEPQFHLLKMHSLVYTAFGILAVLNALTCCSVLKVKKVLFSTRILFWNLVKATRVSLSPWNYWYTWSIEA